MREPALRRLCDPTGSRAALGTLGDSQREHAVLHLRVDPIRLELAAEREATAIASDCAGQVRLRPFRKLHGTLQQQSLAVDVYVQSLLRDSGDVGIQGDAVRVLKNVDRGTQDRLGRRYIPRLNTGGLAGNFRTRGGHLNSPQYFQC
jgi:hypothetical protein